VQSKIFQGPENKNPAQGRAVVKAKDDNKLPGRMFDFRSARARGHAGGHAGAGDDIGESKDEAHDAHVNTGIAAAQ
jgi:hypothetical protein